MQRCYLLEHSTAVWNNQLESGQRRNNDEVEASHLEATSESRFRNCLAGRS